MNVSIYSIRANFDFFPGGQWRLIDALSLNLAYGGLESASAASGASMPDAFGMMLTDALAESLETAAQTADGAQSDAAAATGKNSLLDLFGGETNALLMLTLMNSLGGEAGTVMMSSLANALNGRQAGSSGAYATALRAYAGTGAVSSTSTYSNTSDRIPASAGKAVSPSVTSSEGNRSAALYTAVIRQFNVTKNPRYAVNKNGNNDTYCNIFLWDVTRAMGAEIPHYVDPVTKAPRAYPDVKGAKEMTANDIYDWLHSVGEQYGWYKVTAEQAQALANQGKPVVTAMKNDSGHGHVQVVCPSKDGGYNTEKGVTIAQAGRNLYDYAYVTQVYNASLSKLTYFAHR